jgi:predicted dehydrogenase
MSETKLRWGILSTAQIARKNWKAIRNTGNSTVVAVASRDVERSRRFIGECQSGAPVENAVNAYGSYEELLADREVDAVYIPLPTGLRKEWVMRAAAAGKHIVCEKPCATSVAELGEMIEACRRHRVQFMDGVMFMHSRRLEAIRTVLDEASGFGHMRRITSSFSFLADEGFFRSNIRASSVLEPYGCLGDLGWYCIRFALWARREQLPRRVSGRILNEVASAGSPGPVPTEFSGEMFFDEGASCSFYCSFRTANEQWVTVSGTNGYVRVSDFVLPYFGNEAAVELTNASFEVAGCDFNMEERRRRISVAEYSNSHPTSQETNLFRNFSSQVQSGKLNEAWPEMAFKTQQVMNACFESARAGSRFVELG